MKATPIIFSAPMVRAILEGRKTQTRRVVKCRTPIAAVGSAADWDRWKAHPEMANPANVLIGEDGRPFSIPCPYGFRSGKPGGLLWVRETWAYHLHAQGSLADDDGPWVYAADGPQALQYRLCERWRPSIHMPRYASRIGLEVTDVRIERLRDISEADAVAEGVEQDDTFRGMPLRTSNWRAYGNEETMCCTTATASYRTLWETINGAGSWEANPWVWVVQFKQHGGRA